MRTFSAITSRLPFTLLGIVLALVVIAAFVLVALNASTANLSPKQTVVFAIKDLQPRIPIAAGDLTIKQLNVPNDYPKVYFGNVNEVVGMVPLVTIFSGEVVSANDVAKPNQALGSQAEYLAIPQGYVALTIPTSEQQGVAGFIQPGDYISVIATVQSNGRVADKTIFTQLHVIKVGPPATSPGATTTASSLTVVVTQCEAEVITWFLTYASLKYTLESYKDYAPGAQNPDPKCPSVNDAKGVTLPVIQANYPSLF
ncbi:MAG TPA: Flp pilus assembly protein CpaB [Candidatus Dormibacteraeota bacterium]|nr:Flp pilus assembly protein CpaB [Candidatus Dormibacteraeota bacterium]